MSTNKIGGTADTATDLRARIVAMLAERGRTNVAEDESLFLSGVLDSLAAAEVLGILESDFGVDLSDLNFDITEIDTLARLDAMVRRLTA